MGFLDDYVKLQHGKSFTELFGAIGETIRERRAQDIIADNLKDLDLASFKNMEDLGRELAMRKQSLMQTLPVELQMTKTFETVDKNISEIASSVVSGRAAQLTGEKQIADTKEATARAAEIASETKMRDSEAPLSVLQHFPSEYMEGFKKKPPTYRQLEAIAKAETPYIHFDTAGLQGQAALVKRNQDLMDYKTQFITPFLTKQGLGEYFQIPSEKMNQYLLDNNWDAISNEIARIAAKSGMNYADAKVKAMVALQEGALDYKRTGASRSAYETTATVKAIDEAYEAYRKSFADPITGQIPPERQNAIEDKAIWIQKNFPNSMYPYGSIGGFRGKEADAIDAWRTTGQLPAENGTGSPNLSAPSKVITPSGDVLSKIEKGQPIEPANANMTKAMATQLKREQLWEKAMSGDPDALQELGQLNASLYGTGSFFKSETTKPKR